MFHPFIDTTKLTDDELLSRIQKCQEVVYSAQQSGHHTMFQSAMLQLETYRTAWEERMHMQRFKEEQEKNPNKVIEIGTIEEVPNKKTDT
jgi:hypothetical protein